MLSHEGNRPDNAYRGTYSRNGMVSRKPQSPLGNLAQVPPSNQMKMAHRNTEFAVAWNAPAFTDEPRSVRGKDAFDPREHMAAEAFSKGGKWYARFLLNAQQFPNSIVGSKYLLGKSRTLLAESRIKIQRTRTVLAFRSRVRRDVN